MASLIGISLFGQLDSVSAEASDMGFVGNLFVARRNKCAEKKNKK